MSKDLVSTVDLRQWLWLARFRMRLTALVVPIPGEALVLVQLLSRSHSSVIARVVRDSL